MKLEVVYQDDYLLVLDKPPGLVSHPVGHYQGDTLIRRIHSIWGREVRLLHRLDRETSGIVLSAWHPKFVRPFYRLFERREITKNYLVLVHGTVAAPEGMIEEPIAPATSSSSIKIKMQLSSEGLSAQTKYRVLSSAGDYSLVLATPITGRKHQIRLHFASLGHPVVGDKIYAYGGLPFLWEYYLQSPPPLEWSPFLTGQGLHAYSVSFVHPFLKKNLTLTTSYPKRFEKLVPYNLP